MPPVAPTRPLWWLARWVARLLTGFAVAAAFTLGAWALPAHAAPADHAGTVSLPQPVTPSATPGWDLVAPHDPVTSATTVGRGDDGHTVLDEAPATPGVAHQPEPTAPREVAVEVTPPSATVAGRPAPRAPPRA